MGSSKTRFLAQGCTFRRSFVNRNCRGVNALSITSLWFLSKTSSLRSYSKIREFGRISGHVFPDYFRIGAVSRNTYFGQKMQHLILHNSGFLHLTPKLHLRRVIYEKPFSGFSVIGSKSKKNQNVLIKPNANNFGTKKFSRFFSTDVPIFKAEHVNLNTLGLGRNFGYYSKLTG